MDPPSLSKHVSQIAYMYMKIRFLFEQFRSKKKGYTIIKLYNGWAYYKHKNVHVSVFKITWVYLNHISIM